jgi:hypothetical protein
LKGGTGVGERLPHWLVNNPCRFPRRHCPSRRPQLAPALGPFLFLHRLPRSCAADLAGSQSAWPGPRRARRPQAAQCSKMVRPPTDEGGCLRNGRWCVLTLFCTLPPPRGAKNEQGTRQ